jgi:hypothetical protein
MFKNIAFIILIQLAGLTQVFSNPLIDNLNWEEKYSNIDFAGCLVVQNNIFAYGSEGNYLVSTDKGQSWNQKKIQGASDILDFEIIDNTIYGFTYTGQLLKSNNFGINWEISNLDNLSNIYFVKFYNNYFFVRTNKSINVYDKNMKFISKYESDILNIESGPTTLNYILMYFNLTFVKNQLIVPSKSNKLIIINVSEFSKNNLLIDSISICDSCTKGISRIINYNDKLLLSVSMNNPSNNKATLYYQYNLTSNTFSEIDNNTMSQLTGKYTKLNGTNFRFKENTPIGYFGKLMKFKIDTLDTANDSLYNIGNTSLISMNVIDNFNDVKAIDKNTLIAVGQYKLMMISNDNGRNWNLVSCFGDFEYWQPTFISKNIQYYDNFYLNRSIISSDGGIIFKPTLQNFENDLNLTNIIKNKQTKIGTSYFDTTGIVINIYNSNFSNFDNISISNDFGKTINFKRNIELNVSNADFKLFKKFDNNFKIVFNIKESSKNYFKSLTFDLDMNLLKSNVDSINTILYTSFKSENEGFLITSVKELEPQIVVLNWLEDSKSWKRDTIISTFFTNLNSFKIGKSGDSVMIVTSTYDGLKNNNYIYVYDNKSKTTNKLFEIKTVGVPKYLLEFGSKYYLVGDNLCLENINYDFKKWQEKLVEPKVEWNRIIKFVNSEKYYVSLWDPIKKTSIKYILSNDSKSNIENTTITDNINYFQSMPPFPLPAKNELKSLIYWDMSYNIDDSDIEVYDIYGNKVANREKISLNKLNSYSGYLTWDCSGAGTGVYIIQIKHGTNTHNIRAMVVR